MFFGLHIRGEPNWEDAPCRHIKGIVLVMRSPHALNEEENSRSMEGSPSETSFKLYVLETDAPEAFYEELVKIP